MEIVFATATKPGSYWPMLGATKLCHATRQPFLDGARALQAMGHPPTQAITGRHVWSSIVAMRSTIGEAAKWSVGESDRGGLSKRRWMAFSWHPGNSPGDDAGVSR